MILRVGYTMHPFPGNGVKTLSLEDKERDKATSRTD
jgi:hypothetical protein